MSQHSSIGLGRRILLVEDDQGLADVVRRVLIDHGFEVAVARDAADGYELAQNFDPDQALLDVMLGEGPTGVDLAHSISITMPWIPLILLTNVLDLQAAGLPEPPPDTGLVHKAQAADLSVLIDAMEASFGGHELSGITSPSPFRHMTTTQVTVLRMMAQGWTNEAIARQRGCTRSAVENRVNDVYRLLLIGDHPEVNRRAEAVRIFVSAVGPVQRPGDSRNRLDLSRLSPAQRQILPMLANGYSNESIARTRGCSESAVEQLLSGAYRAIRIDANPDISIRAEAVRLFINTFGPPAR